MEKRRNFVVSTYLEGEGHHIWTPITEEQINQIEKIVGIDMFDELSLDHPIEIKEITDEQSVESELNGASIDGCDTKEEQIRYLLDNGISTWQLEIIKNKYPDEFEKAESFKNLEEMQEAE